MYHQGVDIVALVAHHLNQKHRCIYNKVVKAPEVGHRSTIIYIGEGTDESYHYYEYRCADKALAWVLVAQKALYLQFKVFANLSISVQEAELRYVLYGSGLGCPSYLSHDVVVLQFPVYGCQPS